MKTESRSQLYLMYLKAGLFLLPSFLVLLFVNVFVLPKLFYLQSNAGLSNEQLSGTLVMPQFLVHNGSTMFLALACSLIIFEWRLRSWQQYRKAIVGSLIFLINTTVLVNLTSIIIAALIIAPVLSAR